MFDYYRATVPASIELVLDALAEGLAGEHRGVHRAVASGNQHYAQHVELRDWRGRILTDVFWGGMNVHPNVEAKGSLAPPVVAALRALGKHRPSRVDVKRDATREGLYGRLLALALEYKARHGLRGKSWDNHDPDMGNTMTLGSRQSQVYLRIYQPGMKRAQEEGRTGYLVADEERQAVRVELEFKPEKGRAKLAAATLSPTEMWGVSPWVAEFAAEVFAMDVQPITISERLESNRERALRYMATQYQAHLKSLLDECEGDSSLFGDTILDLAGIERRNN